MSCKLNDYKGDGMKHISAAVNINKIAMFVIKSAFRGLKNVKNGKSLIKCPELRKADAVVKVNNKKKKLKNVKN